MIFKWNLSWANLGSPEAPKRRNGFQGKNGEEPWWKTTQDCRGFTCIEICGWSLMFFADTNLSTDPLIRSSISFAIDVFRKTVIAKDPSPQQQENQKHKWPAFLFQFLKDEVQILPGKDLSMAGCGLVKM